MESADKLLGSLPPRGRLLGVDFGTVRIGLALCDPERTLASPETMFPVKSDEHDRQRYAAVINRWQPSGIVVGLPLHKDGRESPMSRRCCEHAAWLHKRFALPCIMHDERHTSQEAEASLWSRDLSFAERKDRVDAIAAAVMLQAFLDHACRDAE